MIRKLIVMVIVICMVVITSATSAQSTEAKTYILVHGAFQNSSVWSDVIPILEAEGYTAIAVDLLGHGADETPIETITLAAYRDAIVTVIEEQAQPVILVGHSFAGMVISEVAEVIPDQIETLVYVSAFLPQNGQSLNDISMMDQFTLISEDNFTLAEDFTYATILESEFLNIFCGDCTEAQGAGVLAAAENEPLTPLGEPSTVTAENFGTVEKVYVLTAQDRNVSPQLQAMMLAYTPVDRVFALDTSHAPFTTMPDALAAILLGV